MLHGRGSGGNAESEDAKNKQNGDGFENREEAVVAQHFVAAQPGSMLALMGSSGAGKTTLLDVIAGRKNTGIITGEIKLNGHVVKQETFARLTAYCEQMDMHNEF